MPNLLAKGQELFARLMKQDASPPGAVTYRRGAETVDLTAKCWVGRWIVTEIPQEGGGYVTYGDRDYLIPVADLAVNGNEFEPEEGHRITEVINGVECNFDVLPPTGEPSHRYSDPGQTIWRVHTKQQK